MPVVANDIVDKVIADDGQFSFTLPANTFANSDWRRAELSARTGPGAALPAWLKFDAVSRTFSGRPDDDDIGKIAIAVTASDSKGGTVCRRTNSFAQTR
ncbi:Putative Ig domain-containing protein [Devosia sp. YR412]|uniref:putative Ig domain-containing protein n=1 Tax=Devosia sp. YR412 TaxID=1881030 RepID=UPI0008CB6A38|nr:putative Ig domain-containing protein [Devosia sp. YR412]SEQ29939.1 Putative Ig domain-containing protein [Devosia sp. YR412]